MTRSPLLSSLLLSLLVSLLLPALLPAPLLAGTGTAATATPLPSIPPQDDLDAGTPRAFLVTIGPGAQVWERFGHNALWIHDPVRGTDVAYHYGLFDMSEEGFLTEFLQGRMLYSMGAADAGLLLEAYRRAGRSATVQELSLTRSQIAELRAFLEWNMRPENRVYRYDYFRDNCSTRVRDALDRVLDGALSRALRSRQTPITYREEAVALTAEDELLATGMDLGLGPLADQRLSRWELAFIPMRLREDVATLTVSGEDGSRPLAGMERELPALGVAEEELAMPPAWVDVRVGWMLLLGLLIGGAFVVLGWLASRRSGGGARVVARWTLVLTGSAWGLLAGVLGLVLLGLWTLTDHEFAHANENLLQVNPVALALVVLVPAAVAGGRLRTPAFYVAAALLGLSALGLLVHPLPLTPQGNLGIIALALPVHAGLLDALRRQTRPGG